MVDIYRCVHSNKIYFAVLSMALKLFFSIFQNEIWTFYWIVTLAFWGHERVSVLDECMLILITSRSSCKKTYSLQRVKPRIFRMPQRYNSRQVWRDSGSLNSTSAEELYERSNGSWWCTEGQPLLRNHNSKKTAFKYVNFQIRKKMIHDLRGKTTIFLQ